MEIGCLFFEAFKNKDPSFVFVFWRAGEMLDNLQHSRREGISLGGVYTLKRREIIDRNGYKNEIRTWNMCVCVCD